MYQDPRVCDYLRRIVTSNKFDTGGFMGPYCMQLTNSKHGCEFWLFGLGRETILV